MKLRALLSAPALTFATIVLGSGACAFAGPITNMNFVCGNNGGQGTVSSNSITGYNGSICSGNNLNGGAAHGTLDSWAQAVYSIGNGNTSGFTWNLNQGIGNGNLGAGVVGDPSLTTLNAGGNTGTGTLTVTDGPALFQFDSVNLKTTAGDVVYTIQGYLGNALEFALTCGRSGNPACTIASKYGIVNGGGDSNIDIDKLVITETSTSGGRYDAFSYLDNIDLTSITAIPEPASLVLLGSGILAMALVLRRRRSQVKTRQD
jgi:hypothetical protein